MKLKEGIETATDLIKVVEGHLDVNPKKLMVDLYLDASCLGHLLSPDISIKNCAINNIINNIRNSNNQILQLLPETTIRYGWAKGTVNPADFTSKLFLTPTSILNRGFYRHGPIDYMRSDSYSHIFFHVSKNGQQY